VDDARHSRRGEWLCDLKSDQVKHPAATVYARKFILNAADNVYFTSQKDFPSENARLPFGSFSQILKSPSRHRCFELKFATSPGSRTNVS
jgi:hypothetical protein